MGEKTEEATPKKLADARKKGQVARSQDFPSAATFIVSIVVLLGLWNWIIANLSGYLISCFKVLSTTPNAQLQPLLYP